MIVNVYVKDFKKDIEGFGKPQCIDVPSMPCKVAFDISGKIDDADYNIVRDRLMESMEKSQVAEKFQVQAYKLTKKADQEVAGLLVSDRSKIEAVFKSYDKDIRAEIKKFEGEVGDAFKAGWTKLLEDRQKYKAYKFKAAIDFTVNILSLTASVAGLATAATPAAPVTAVMGAYGILKNVTKICVQCRNLYVEAETVAKDVEKDVATLKAKVEKVQKQVDDGTDKAAASAKKSKAVIKVKELAVATGNKLFGDVVSVFITSIEGATKKNSLYGNKIRGIQEGTVDFAKDYLKMIDHLEELHKYVRALDDEYAKISKATDFSPEAKPILAKRQKQIKTAFDAWNGATKAMKEMNDTVSGSEKRYADNLAKQKAFQGHIDAAEKAFKTKNWAEAGRWLGVAADVGLSVGPAGAASWSSTSAIVASVMKLVMIAEKEVITELKNKF